MDAIVDPDACRSPAELGETSDAASFRFQLGDGRRLGYRLYGVCDGYPVLALHGTPGSGLMFRGADSMAASLRQKLICPDRWGYCDTSPHPMPGLSSFSQDILALLDSLGVERFSLVGVSGGGPYAIGVAAAAGNRVDRLALVSPVGPLVGLRNRDMRIFHRLCFRVLPRVPMVMKGLLQFYRRLLLLAPRTAIDMATTLSIRVDREIAQIPVIRDGLAASFRAGLERHTAGAVCDVNLFSSAWDIDPGSVLASSRIWLGTLDRNIPQAAVLELAKLIPQAELTWVEDEGHFVITRRHEEVLRWLADVGMHQKYSF